MAHKGKYTPPQKKKKKDHRLSVTVTQTQPGVMEAQSQAQAASPPLMARVAPVRANPASASAVPASVKYADLPRELRWVGIFTTAVVVLLVILWFVLK